MRKKLLMFTAVLSATALSAQQAIIVNGGQYGNPSNNVNLVSYDIQTDVYTLIDTIQTQSVQTLLVEGNVAYIAAQDSIVSYDLTTNTRIAAAAFNGLSTKALSIYNNTLLVGNWYGKTTDNLYAFDKLTLSLTDSVSQITKGVSNMVVHGDSLYIAQNYTSSGYTDSAGYISVVDLNTMNFVRDITFSNNGEGLGFLVKNSAETGFLGINTNSIVKYDFATGTISSSPTIFRLSAGASKHAKKGDTLFLQVNDNIGSISLTTGNIIDTNIVAYSPTSFTLDTLSNTIYATSTDFFSYKEGKVFDYNGMELDTLVVGYSPEIVQIYYGNVTSIERFDKEMVSFSVFPNPASNKVNIDLNALEKDSAVKIRITDISGKTVLEENLSSMNAFSLNIDNLTSGIYLINLQSERYVGVQKMIVK